jgi:hypothetical protein
MRLALPGWLVAVRRLLPLSHLAQEANFLRTGTFRESYMQRVRLYELVSLVRHRKLGTDK